MDLQVGFEAVKYLNKNTLEAQTALFLILSEESRVRQVEVLVDFIQ